MDRNDFKKIDLEKLKSIPKKSGEYRLYKIIIG